MFCVSIITPLFHKIACCLFGNKAQAITWNRSGSLLIIQMQGNLSSIFSPGLKEILLVHPTVAALQWVLCNYFCMHVCLKKWRYMHFTAIITTKWWWLLKTSQEKIANWSKTDNIRVRTALKQRINQLHQWLNVRCREKTFPVFARMCNPHYYCLARGPWWECSYAANHFHHTKRNVKGFQPMRQDVTYMTFS